MKKKARKPVLTMGKPAEAIEPEVVPSVALTETKPDEAEKLITTAREYFGQMQRSWFGFAKVIALIKSTESYKVSDEVFKDFCMREYPTVSFSTITKFIAIAESFGEAIESRIKKDENYMLPAYESVYQLVTIESRLPKEELSKLRKAVLDSRMSYLALREKLKDSLGIYKKKISEEVDKSTEEIERQLIDDLRDDDLAEPESLFEDPAAVEIEDEKETSTSSVLACLSRVEYLKENLPELKKQIKKDKEISEEIVDLAKELEVLQELSADFLKMVEDISNE